MDDESVNEPRDPAEVMFTQLEQQVIYINRNVRILMEALNNKQGIFGEDEGSNA